MGTAEMQAWMIAMIATVGVGVLLGYVVGLLLGISRGKESVLCRVRRLMVEGRIADDVGSSILGE